MTLFYKLLFLWILIGLCTFVFLIFSKTIAPYGRHFNSEWGITIDNKWGWFWMELPALVLMPVIILFSPVEKNGIIILTIGLWILHYFYRTILFPIKLKTKGKKIPLVIVISAFVFNLFNGFFVGYEIGNISQLNFGINTLIGLIIFFAGMYINRSSDNKLISLRKENKEYQIPKGGMFKYISCPNHFGEIVEWIGFTVIVFNLGTLSFALWTSFNLIPRALNHHNWYINHFKEYPVKRKAIIPFII
tara:strand:- start:66 stop:806 length:741 start_codon:yes stop_codon:yes gene_type:complete